MLIETWILVLLIAYAFVVSFVSLFGWMKADRLLKYERDTNNELHEEIIYLTDENARLNSKISIAQLYIEEKTK